MTIQRVTPDDFETFTIVTNPTRTYTSSSLYGTTGSVYLFARRSPFEKETRSTPQFVDTARSDHNLDSVLQTLQRRGETSTNILSGVASYMSGVNTQQQSARKQKVLDIQRFTPSFTYSDRTVKKIIVRENLMPYHRSTHSSYNYGFTNYHSLNFFTASTVPNGTALLYPNVPGPRNNFISGTYVPTGSFTFDFYINPRYTTDSPGLNFKAGTIMHLSSTYAVSLISGSSRDINGFVDGYRVLLQLSHSADIAPSIARAGNKPNDLIFSSSDNSLRRNHWHHVVIRWGTSNIQHGTGSILIDGRTDTSFVIPSATIAPLPFVNKGTPDVLVIGNFYEGTNNGSSVQASFFAADPANRDGLQVMLSSTGIELPAAYSHNHPLNAELHDIMLKNVYSTDHDLVSGSGAAPVDLDDALFYLPPYFTEVSPHREFVGTFGGVLQTPFFAIDGTTVDPFNIGLSFGVGGHYVNLENFGLDLGSGLYPRWFNLTGSEITNTTTAMSCNDFMYATASIRKRNVTVLPCDDGEFIPNYDLLSLFMTSSVKAVDDLGASSPGFISLNNMVPSGSVFSGFSVQSGSIFDGVSGPSPESIGLEPGEILSIFQRTRDNSSNEVVLFNISNMFYGNRIYPGSLVIQDTAITGTAGKLSITLKDDGLGNIYRADCATSQSTWNSVGNVFYDEGLVIIKSPMIPFFGQDQYSITFQGEQNIHTLRFNLLAKANTLNSSSNPSYLPVSASSAVNIEEQQFVYLSNINLHDDNLNVVMKTQLVQPVVKRVGDRIMFKIKMDF